VSLYFEIQTVS